MSDTLFTLDLLNAPVGLVASATVGLLFGAFLEQAGFGSSRRLTGIFYLRDMSVLKVMFTAIVVSHVGLRLMGAAGLIAPSSLYLLDTYWGAQIIGGALFGIGFALGGWCPGTALVGVASAKLDALVFLIGVGLGSVFFNEIYPWVEPLYQGQHAGPQTLADTLGLPLGLLTVLLCAAAVGAFALSTKAEQRFGAAPSSPPRKVLQHRLAAVGLLGAALLCLLLQPHSPQPLEPSTALQAPAPALAPAPLPAAPSGAALALHKAELLEAVCPPSPGSSPILAEVAEAVDHVDAEDLARWMMDGAPDLTVVDLRSREEFEAFHLRGARHIPIGELAEKAQSLPRKGRIILYSNGTTHAAQAWLEMRRWGFPRVRVLTDGVLGFWRDCLTPPSLRTDPPQGAMAEEALASWEKCRDWFLPKST